LRDFTEGVLEGLAYSLMVMRRERGSKAPAKISQRILKILDAQAGDLENRIEATA
jgi:hypothetical protein